MTTMIMQVAAAWLRWGPGFMFPAETVQQPVIFTIPTMQLHNNGVFLECHQSDYLAVFVVSLNLYSDPLKGL